jgi:glycine/D-amino acid oxidase-like deaminating enzyme
MSVGRASTADYTLATVSLNWRLPSRRDGRTLTASDIRNLVDRVLPPGKHHPADPATRRKLQAIDRSSRFSPEALLIFQDLLARLGIATARPIGLPLNDIPFWHRTANPFASYQSTPDLPAHADIVIIGAGLTGAAAAYHLRNSGRAVVLLDQGDPAGEASGRNGGNFELIPENSVGVYEGLAPGRFAYMKRRYPQVPEVVVRAVSEQQASLVLGLALRNRDLLKETILNERIACDFSPKGWLHLAANGKEEQAICDEVSLAAQHGQRIEIWSCTKIREEFGIDAAFLGRFIPGDGTYHPFKLVCGEIKSALRSGVALYTQTQVRHVVSDDDGKHRIVTNRGTIVAGGVIVATNAFTSRLFPKLAAIVPYQSQILVTEHVPDRACGRSVTSDTGPVFFNQAREGARDGRAGLIMGGGRDRRMKNPSSRRRSAAIHAHLLALRDTFYPELAGQPPSAEWIGPMAFTPDGLPCIGFLRPGVVIAAGYNGYGGSYATAGGSVAAEMILTDSVPDLVPEAIFSPRRLMGDKPYFLTEQKGLWQVAKSLCDQLQAVNRRISDALTFDHTGTFGSILPSQRVSRPPGQSTSSASMEVSSLRKCGAFANYSRDEIRSLLHLMQRWDLKKNTVIFTEGSPGGTCFVIVEGSVNVSINAHGQQQLLAILGSGQIFGQVSIIEDIPRSATCTARTDVVMIEIGQAECEMLLKSKSSIALKFLATLNDGLIAALRESDLRLLQIERSNHNDGAQ